MSPSGGAAKLSAIHSSVPARGNVLLALVVAMGAVIVTYDGWFSAIYFMEEDQDPTEPAALGTRWHSGLHCDFRTGEPRAAARPADRSPGRFRGASRRRRYADLWRSWQTIILVVAPITAAALYRLPAGFAANLFAISRDGLLPRWMASVNRGGTPAGSLLASAMISFGLVLSGSFEALIAIASFLFVAVYISGFAALFKLRARHPELSQTLPGVGLSVVHAWACYWCRLDF